MDEPLHGIRDMDQAAAGRPKSVIARLLLAQARTVLIMDSGDCEHAASALEDAGVAVSMLPPGNPVALTQSVLTNLAAAAAYEERGRPEDQALAKFCRETAQRDAQALRESGWAPSSFFETLAFLSCMGDDAVRREECRRMWEKTHAPAFGGFYLRILYEQGALKEALTVADTLCGMPGTDPQYLVDRTFLVAELRTVEEALEVNRQAAEKSGTALNSTFPIMVLQLLGAPRDQVAAAAKELLEPDSVLHHVKRGWYRRLVEFTAGTVSEEELLRVASPSRQNLCEAHFGIALRRLGEGNRQAARHHFELVLRTGVTAYVESIWSRIFLGRMKDAAWPPWTPVKGKDKS
jgi:hypothetical protein